MSKRLIALGDLHAPYQNDQAVEVAKKTIQDFKPDIVVLMGDMIDCKAFATHAPDIEGDSPYHKELAIVNEFIDFVQKHTAKTVYLEGNHEYRVIRHAARDRVGKAALSLLSPRKNIGKGRRDFTYVPYDGQEGMNAHYAVSPNLVAVHGWSYAQDATRQHLKLCQGKSVIHGHTHRADHVMSRQVWKKGTIDAMSSGCLCDLAPKYSVGNPNTWVNGFIQGFIGSRKDHTLYFVPIVDDHCILPNGKEVRV